MTKKEVLQSMNSLIRDLDTWTGKRVRASLDKDEEAYDEAMFQLEGLISDSQQELTFLTDYIKQNVEDEPQKTLEEEIRSAHIRFPEISFAKLSRVAVRFYKLGLKKNESYDQH